MRYEKPYRTSQQQQHIPDTPALPLPLPIPLQQFQFKTFKSENNAQEQSNSTARKQNR